MARFHFSTNTPTKLELMAEWLPTQAWAAGTDGPLASIGSFHLDDPDGEVGIQTHIVEVGGTRFQVPFTYRAEPLAGAEAFFVGEMQHSVLGPRFVYDAIGDPQYVLMLAAVTLLGYGQAVGVIIDGGRRYAQPSAIQISGTEPPRDSEPMVERDTVSIDGFELVVDDPLHPTFRDERFELRLYRRPVSGSAGLLATWDGNTEPVVLADVRPL